jgi:hypothetical protein
MPKHLFYAATPRAASRATLVAVVFWLFATAVGRADDPLRKGYDSGFSNITKIAGELHAALEPRNQQAVQPGIILLEAVQAPCVSPVEIQKDGHVLRTVQFSTGAIHFINSVSHAKALSQDDSNVIKAYAARLAPSALPPAVADGMPPEKAWAFDVMNIQTGQFNQMAGALVAIDYAHHYLGHYKKYAGQLSPDATGTVPPISEFVTEKEWREAVLKGAKNALDCGLGVDGLKALFECMEAMPSRPGWCAYFVPAKANLSKLSKDLQRLENDFFLVGK